MSANDDTLSQDGVEPTDRQAAYIFSTTEPQHDRSARPTKKRKISASKQETLETPADDAFNFVPLLHGAENGDCLELRKKLFRDGWAETEERIEVGIPDDEYIVLTVLQEVLRESNEKTLIEVSSFIETLPVDDHENRVPAALIATGPNIASQDLLFKQITEKVGRELACPAVILRSSEASNLKTALKKLIRDTTSTSDELDAKIMEPQRARDGHKYLNYCLRNLQDFVQAAKCERVVVCLQDSEAFDSSLLTDLVLLFHSWLDRIPFVLVFGIATSIDLFHERLTRGAIRCLQGEQFGVEQVSSTIEKIFRKTVGAECTALRLGSGIVSMLVERQTDHAQSVQDFVRALKYSYMCHFYANPLSVFWAIERYAYIKRSLLSPEHFEAIRTLPSFKYLVESYLARKNTTKARALLQSDDALFDEIKFEIQGTHRRLRMLLRSIDYLQIMRPSLSYMETYINVFSGNPLEDETVDDVIASVKPMEPKDLEQLIHQLVDVLQWDDTDADDYGDFEYVFITKLQSLMGRLAGVMLRAEAESEQPRSTYSIHSKTIRATVIAQRVRLSKEKAPVSGLDDDYTKIIDDLVAALQENLQVENPQHIFPSEVWLYDSKAPVRDVFIPRPRYAIERALSSPHDYLGCQCCAATEGGLGSTQPASAILYQLYLESAPLINVFDLWSAFYTIIGGEAGGGCDERTALMLFYRGLSDLKLLGLVKQSRKKTDHLAKLSWRGL